MKAFVLLLIIGLSSIVSNVRAQGGPIPVFPHYSVDIEELRNISKQKVSRLVDYLGAMTERYPELTYEQRCARREKYRQAALNLFIGKGVSYDLPGGRRCSAVEIEVTSTKYGKNRKRTSLYLKNLIGLAEDYYAEVSISNYDVIECSDIKPMADGWFVCTVSFTQEFVSRRKDSNKYNDDLTEKEVQVYLKIDLDKNNRPKVWAYLGDITAGETYVPRNPQR